MSTTREAKRDAKIWDYFAKGYSKKPIEDEEAYHKKLQMTQQHLRKDMNVLEYGCGTGGTSIIHAPFVKKILATDVSGKMLEIAQQKAQEAEVTNVEFKKSSVDELDLPKESQDVVLGLSILHLLKNRDEAISKTHGWLKPGGLFISSTICIGEMGFMSHLLKVPLRIGTLTGTLPHVYMFKKEDLKKSITRNGFTIEYEWQPKPNAAVFLIARKV